MFRYFSSGEVSHIPARDSQHTEAAARPIASQYTEREIPSTESEVNAEQTGAWSRDNERTVDMEAAANNCDGEECSAPSADENDYTGTCVIKYKRTTSRVARHFARVKISREHGSQGYAYE